MAKLYKKARSPYWWCDYKLNGIRKRKSSGIRIGNTRGKKPAIGSDAEKWLIKFENDLAFKQIGISTVHDIALTDLFPKYVNHYKQQFEAGAVKEATYNRINERSKLWLKRCLKHGITGVKALTPELALQYRNNRRKKDDPNGEPVTHHTWNRECTSLGHIWTFAKDKLEIDCKNYWADAHYKKPKTVNKHRCLTDDEVQLLLYGSDKFKKSWWYNEWKYLTYVMYYTGARINAAAELQISSVIFDERLLWLSNKNSDDHNAYMPDALFDFLKKYKPESEPSSGMYLKAPAKGASRTDYWIRQWPISAKQIGVKCTAHDVRNTYVTRMTEQLDQRVSMNIVGHSSAKIHELYNHNMAWKYADKIESVLSVPKLQNKDVNVSVLQSVG
jgi:integrase